MKAASTKSSDEGECGTSHGCLDCTVSGYITFHVRTESRGSSVSTKLLAGEGGGGVCGGETGLDGTFRVCYGRTINMVVCERVDLLRAVLPGSHYHQM